MVEPTLKEMIVEFLTSIEDGREFSPRDICTYIYRKTDGHRNPMDATVTRIMRKVREDGYDWYVKDAAKGTYVRGSKSDTPTLKKKISKPYSYKY